MAFTIPILKNKKYKNYIKMSNSKLYVIKYGTIDCRNPT